MEKSLIANEAGRLDKVLALHLQCSRSQVAKLIDTGNVKVDGVTAAKAGIRLNGGENIEYTVVEVHPKAVQPLSMDIDVLYEDDFLMVVNKPAGLVVHPAPSVKDPTLVDWLRGYGVSLSTISGEERQGIVHRIDKDTTGALAVAKTDRAHSSLSRQLKEKSMGRYYLAIIDHPLKESITVDAPIGRNPKNRLKMAVVENGRDAKTDFMKLLEFDNGTELIAARLHSGRTHQIRVHLASLGRHIIGDILYGYKGKKADGQRVFLHAHSIYFRHPSTEESVNIIAPLFEDMERYIKKNIPAGVEYEKIVPENISKDFTGIFSVVERVCDRKYDGDQNRSVHAGYKKH